MSITDLFRRKQKCIEQIQVTEEARVIIDSPLVKDFFAKTEAAIFAKWKETPDDALDARERLFVLNGMLRNFEQYFNAFIVNGKFAEKELEEIVKQETVNGKKR